MLWRVAVLLLLGFGFTAGFQVCEHGEHFLAYRNFCVVFVVFKLIEVLGYNCALTKCCDGKDRYSND